MASPRRRAATPSLRDLLLLVALPLLLSGCGPSPARGGDLRRVVEVPGEPRSVVWAVQLSDLHLSAFHPERAADFRRHVGDALAMVNPALVLITGDLTDAKSKDLLSSRQDEFEWILYGQVIDDVANRSGLSKEVFYDLRGNHDSYGVPEVGGMFDFYKKHSINARLGRTGAVQSITLQNSGMKYLFVGFDSAMGVGLRSPTNIFGQPTDRLLSDLDAALSQWDNQSTSSLVTKIVFGHFPISFSALTTSGRSIRDVFLKHSLSAYLCGHIRTNFGRNLKRHHTSDQQRFSSKQYFQLDIHEGMSTTVSNVNCSARTTESVAEFWEWEMGDWRSARSMRILAIDSGYVSYTDMDFRFGSRDVIIVPTFPLDSRFMHRSSYPYDFACQAMSTTHVGTVRALVFSRYKIKSVTVKIYESHSGSFQLVLEQEMEKTRGKGARGAMYTVPWNWRDFLDELPDRYWLQIEVVDMTGEIYHSEPRPFSVSLTAKVSWTWKEFRVMGCQWNQLYYPILWTTLAFLFSLVLVPRTSLTFYENRFMSKFIRPKMTGRSLGGFSPVAVELSKMYIIWSGMLFYLLYLVFFPWFTGYAVTENYNKMYLHYRGWSTRYLANTTALPCIGLPDVMVIVLPHLLFVVLPAFLLIAAIAAERALYLGHHFSQRTKKDDDHYKKAWHMKNVYIFYWLRKILILLCLPIVWKHWKHCRAIVRAYEVNPFMDAPIYCFGVPALLWMAIYRSSSVGVYQV